MHRTIIAVLAASASACLCPFTVAATIMVPGDQPTIAAALAVASDGDIIQLAAGSYTGPFTIGSKAITLRGAPSDPASVTVAPLPERPGEIASVNAALSDIETLTFEGLTLKGAVRYTLSGGSMVMNHCVIVPDANGYAPSVVIADAALTASQVLISDSGQKPTLEATFTVASGLLALDNVSVAGGSRSLVDARGAAVELVNCAIHDVAPYPFVIQVADGSLSATGCSFASIPSAIAIVTQNANASLDNCTFESIGDVFGDGHPLELDGSEVSLANSEFVGSGGFASEAAVGQIVSGAYLIQGCNFHDNAMSDVGAGALVLQGTGAVKSSTFLRNATFGFAGAVRVTGTATFEDCWFTQNIGGDGDGAVRVNANATFTRCTFAGNIAGDGFYGPEGKGGACGVRSGSATFVECTIVHNEALEIGGGIYVAASAFATLVDTVICGNTPDQISGTFIDGGGNTICGCATDLNGDGVTDGADLAIVLGAWGPCGDCAADINDDGIVNAIDLGSLIGGWGGCG